MQFWTEKDFEVFETPGLDERMAALTQQVRPKFEALGQHFSFYFSSKSGQEFYPHVAKHMRRTVNPPNDSWVAFAPQKRGYKALPHFQIGLWNSHVFVILAVIYEAPNKAEMAQRLLDRDALSALPGDFTLSGDHMKPEAAFLESLGEEGAEKLLVRFRDVKKGEFVIGRHLPRQEAVELSEEQFLVFAEETFAQLWPVYETILNQTKIQQP